MTASAQDDIWSEWLLTRRFPAGAKAAAGWMKQLEEIRARVLEGARIEPGDVVLDVGAGDGLIAFGALEHVGPAGRVIFSDISQPLLDESCRIATDLGVADLCQFLNASADNLSAIAGGSLDVVTTRSVLIYVKDKAESFREFFRVLKPGGRLSIFEPINRMPEGYRELISDDEMPPEVKDLAARIRLHFESLQPPGEDPMLDFDERELLRDCVAAGFMDAHLQLKMDFTRRPPMAWETAISSAGNPKIPSLGEALQLILSDGERTTYERALRPGIEAGGQLAFSATALLQATKPETPGGSNGR